MSDAKTAADRAAPRAILEVLTSSLAGRRFAYTTAELRAGVRLGRAADCTVRFDSARDIKVSGHHALIIETADGVLVRDQGSSNGLYLNRERVTAEGLRVYDGDEIHLGAEGAVVRVVVPGDVRPAAPAVVPEAATAPVKPPAVMPAGGTRSLTRMVDKIGAGVGAGDKTKQLLRAVAHELEARQSKKRGGVVMLVVVLFLLLAGGGAAGVWFYMQEETRREDAQRQAAQQTAEAEKQREAEHQKQMDAINRQMQSLQASMTRQEKLADDLRAEQAKRFDEMKKEVGESTAERVREISEAQFKTLKEITDEQRKQLEAFTAPEDMWRNMVDRYNPSVMLIFVQYPLLNDKGEAVGVESGTGTGWVAKIDGNKAWVVTNKHVIKPFLFTPELAITHAIRGVKPATFDQWTIVCWPPGAKIREKLGDSSLSIMQAWAMVPGDSGGRGGLRVAGFAADDFDVFGDEYKAVLQATGFRTDLPAAIMERVKQAGIHGDTHNDLALLELELRNPGDITTALPIASEEDLKALRQMNSVMSLGYPLGLSVIKGMTVTTSPATGEIRNLQFDAGKIGTSAPILPGNSGGPLIDSHGRVVGVITRRFEATQGEAIAATHARALVEKFAK